MITNLNSKKSDTQMALSSSISDIDVGVLPTNQEGRKALQIAHRGKKMHDVGGGGGGEWEVEQGQQ